VIIPIGHEHDTVRRRPAVTFGIMIACTAMLIIAGSGALDGEIDEQAGEDAAEYFFSHPYLELDERFNKILYSAMGEYQTRQMLEIMRQEYPPPLDLSQITGEQDRLDELTTAALAELGKSSYHRLGLVPAEPSLIGWITHMFMHVGLLHLLGNMLILYLAGPFIEDVWGRPIYAGFYFLAGLFAAGCYVASGPDSMIPMVGASGAIAGVMGAFLVRYWDTRIRFFYIIMFFYRGTFLAPAWVMLPLWFFEQAYLGVVTETFGGGGVAYWAHVAGFVFGVGFALVMKKNQVEERYLDRVLQEKVETEVIRNPRVEQALNARDSGDTDSAYHLLATEVQENPGNRDASLALWTLSAELDKTLETAPVLLALVRLELRSGESGLAAEHWLELKKHAPDLPVSPDLLIRVGQAFLQCGEVKEGLAVLRQALLEGGTILPVSQVLKIARISSQADPGLSAGAARLAMSRPDIQATEKEIAGQLLPSSP
jgi:membrane associated rhomboid family serine protease